LFLPVRANFVTPLVSPIRGIVRFRVPAPALRTLPAFLSRHPTRISPNKINTEMHFALFRLFRRLVGNGGYRFLQELWDKGVPILPEDAIDAMDVFLKAKQG